MSLTDVAGVAGMGFVLLALVINVVYARIGLPMPTSGKNLEEVTDAFATLGKALRAPSTLAPAAWVLTTLFAAGLVSALWGEGAETAGWALVGFAGVLMQNATFTAVEALRFGLASAAARDRGSVAGLWALNNVLFGFNQAFLGIAVLGFTVAGAGAGFIAGWHVWLGYLSAGFLFASAAVTPYNAEGTGRLGLLGLVGWLGWAAWIVAYGVALLGA
ncbi:hypothetical protein [Glycomyces tenuis]|nr:hypothetical protein [Glycomyces tenuis]